MDIFFPPINSWLAKVRVGAKLILFPKYENGEDRLEVEKERKSMSKRDNLLRKDSKITEKSSGLR